MSSISSSIAAIVAGLKKQNADPAIDPGKALHRLQLPGKAHASYVDVVHFGTTDLGIVARSLDDEREHLENTATVGGEASKALQTIEDTLEEAGDLADANANGLSRGSRKANQRKMEELLGGLGDVIANASETTPDVFKGQTTLTAGDTSVQIGQISLDSLGKQVVNGRSVSLKDIARRGILDTTRGHTAAEGARKAIADATNTVKTLRQKLEGFENDNVRPRLGDVANTLAGLYTDKATSLGNSDDAVKLASDLRVITLASSTAALAVGADNWDRDRIITLLTGDSTASS